MSLAPSSPVNFLSNLIFLFIYTTMSAEQTQAGLTADDSIIHNLMHEQSE